MVKRLPAMQETWVQSQGWKDLLEKEMATHSSTLAWKISWTEEPGSLQSMGSQRVGQDWATSLSLLGRSWQGQVRSWTSAPSTCKEAVGVKARFLQRWGQGGLRRNWTYTPNPHTILLQEGYLLNKRNQKGSRASYKLTRIESKFTHHTKDL